MTSYLRNAITALYNTVSAPVAATRDALAERLQSVRETASWLYNKTKERLGFGEALRATVEDTAREEERQEQEGDLTPHEHEHAMNKAYRSFKIAVLPKTDLDGYNTKVTEQVETLVREQVADMGSAKVQMTMWIKWKKVVELPAFPGSPPLTGVDYIEKAFNSSMTEVFQASDVAEIVKSMLGQIKTQVENPALPASGFTLDEILHLHIDFHELQLTKGSSYIPLPPWISNKKAVINPKNKDNACFKWAVIAALHHEEIKKNYLRIAKLEPYAELYNWKGLEFPLSVDKISKFEKNNEDIAVNVLYVHSERKRGTEKEDTEEPEDQEKEDTEEP